MINKGDKAFGLILQSLAFADGDRIVGDAALFVGSIPKAVGDLVKTVLFEGVTNSLNVTSHYLYFKVYGNDDVVYHMPLDGTNRISVLTFD